MHAVAGMPAGKARKVAGQACPASGGDRIGALPDELLHRILSFLSAQQIVQTCVLGRRWLPLWKSAPVLRIVDANFVDANWKAPLPSEKVREFVDSILLLRGSLPLESFELRMDDAAIDDRRVMLWVSYAMQCKVQVLRLSLHNKRGLHSLRPQDLPLASMHLTMLKLSCIAFHGDFLDLSRCPMLKDLEIICCALVFEGKISSQSLKCLEITGSIFSRSSRTHIHAPNLTKLELLLKHGKTPVLESMPLLDLALVDISGNSDCCNSSNYGDCGDENCKTCMPNDTSSVLLHALSQAKKLELGASTNTYIFRRDLKCCPTFSRLKSIILNEYRCVSDVHVLARILEHSPVLEELYVNLYDKIWKLNVTLKGKFIPKELPPTISADLKRVVVRCEVVDETIIQVLKFLCELNIILYHRTEEKAGESGATETGNESRVGRRGDLRRQRLYHAQPPKRNPTCL